ncbi:hypothetical protein HOD96_00920 [Candidatus Falkowbacteria bacterium]|jgi:hypothetical protein|nr:hypothetical protein [Candidatus Falkowbacteria bacterium]MBT4433179.1 hypothetical protein [Candidatus Falkowbacteria bacterium]
MLEQLFGSKIRVKLLRLFLANPEKSYYIRELTRLLDSQINSIRREIDNLASFGILEKAEKKSNKKYFQANTNFVLYPEVRSLILKSHLLIKKGLVKKIVKSGNICYLVLTGIFVNCPNSPVDILIIGKINKSKIQKIIENFEKELNRNINYTLMPKTEFLYRKDVTDKFLYEILDNQKIVLVDTL